MERVPITIYEVTVLVGAADYIFEFTEDELTNFINWVTNDKPSWRQYTTMTGAARILLKNTSILSAKITSKNIWRSKD